MRRMLGAAHPAAVPPGGIDIGREVRGLVILLLFASYENLLKSVCRGLLERASLLRVGNRRLRTGFRLFAVHNVIRSIADSAETNLWKGAGKDLLDCAFNSSACTINPHIFPADGSFMKRSQVSVFFQIFDLGDPGAILKEVWDKLDAIVVERNKIAHGEMTPEEIGRAYSLSDIVVLMNAWETRWLEFITHIEARAGNRDFYRHQRT